MLDSGQGAQSIAGFRDSHAMLKEKHGKHFNLLLNVL